MHGFRVLFALALMGISNRFLIVLVTIINYFYSLMICLVVNSIMIAFLPIKCQKNLLDPLLRKMRPEICHLNKCGVVTPKP